MNFEIIPAIDLLDGRCVRLLQGRAEDETVYSDDPVAMALHWQQQKVRDTAMTPSARMLEEMRENGESFYEFARRKSAEHHRYFDSREIDTARLQEFGVLASDSLEMQQQREAADHGSFAEFLDNYFKDRL